MKKHTILIVGRGQLATELLHDLEGPVIERVIAWDQRDAITRKPCMVVHAGSGRELDSVLRFCADTGSPLLQLSTADSPLPHAPTYPVIICPNVNMTMLSFMAMIKQGARYFQGQDIGLTESHQASKSTKPGTAIHLASSLGLAENMIRSERDPHVQNEALGIPRSFLDRHAYHEIVITDPDVEIRLQTKVLGKSAYARGLGRVIDIVAQAKPAPGQHDIVELIIQNADTANPPYSS